jgi:hypothetical protein
MTDKEKYNFLKKMHPDKSDIELKAAVKEFQVLEGGLAGGQIAKALLKFGQSIFAKKAKEEGVKTAAKMSLKKKGAIAAVGLYAGSQAAGAIGNAMGGNKDETGYLS